MPAAWYAARLVERRAQTPTGRTLVLDVPGWPGHLPGQHVDVRLTADDGYQAVRGYSLAAPADGERIELGVQSIREGEVSPYLADVLPEGAEVEVRGPLGQWFVWRRGQPGPVLLVAGGSGVVPVAAMLRDRRAAGAGGAFHLVYSVRDPGEVWYREVLDDPGAGVGVDFVYTRRTQPGGGRPPGRITAGDLARPIADLGGAGTVYVCGPTGFVETVADLLVGLGQAPSAIRTERFG